MLAAQLEVELIFDSEEGGVGMAEDSDGSRLVLCGVHLDVVLEGVVVNVIWDWGIPQNDQHKCSGVLLR